MSTPSTPVTSAPNSGTANSNVVTSATPIPTPELSSFDKPRLEARLKEVKDHLNSFVGRAGYNPYVYFNARIKPLQDRLKKGEETKALQDSILNLKLEDPTAENCEHNIANPPREAQAAGGNARVIVPANFSGAPKI